MTEHAGRQKMEAFRSWGQGVYISPPSACFHFTTKSCFGYNTSNFHFARVLFILILREFNLERALLVATRSHMWYLAVEPRRRSPLILPYGTMAAVEGNSSVVSVLVYYCCEDFVLFGSLCEKYWLSPGIGFDEPYFCPLQPPECKVLEYTSNTNRRNSASSIWSSNRRVGTRSVTYALKWSNS